MEKYETTSMEITQIIGLGEAQRKIYEELIRKGKLPDELEEAYRHHEQGLDTIIKYQKKVVAPERDLRLEQ